MGELENKEKQATPDSQDNLPTETDEERKARRRREQDDGAKQEALRLKAKAEKLEALLVKDAVSRAKTDEGYLLQLAEDDAELAEKAAKQISHNGRNFKDLGEYRKFIELKDEGGKFDLEAKARDLAEKMFQEFQAKQSLSGVEKVKENLLAKFASEESKAKAEAKWNLLSKAVTSTESAEEVAEMVLAAVKVDKKAKSDENVMKFGSVPSGNRRPSETKPQFTEMDRLLGLDRI